MCGRREPRRVLVLGVKMSFFKITSSLSVYLTSVSVCQCKLIGLGKLPVWVPGAFVL